MPCYDAHVQWPLQEFVNRGVVQVPDASKRERATFVVDTDKDLNFTRVEVAELVHHVTERHTSTAAG